MFHQFEPVLNNFDLVPESAKPFDSAVDSEFSNSPLAVHFELIDAALRRRELESAVAVASRLVELHRNDAAISELDALRNSALRNHDDEMCEAVCQRLAIAYRQKGEVDSAAVWQQQSIAWRNRRSTASRILPTCPGDNDDELSRLACDLSSRGADAFLRKQFVLAETFWRRALAIEEWRGDWEGQAADCGNLGLLAAARGNLRAGIRWLRKSLQLHRLMLDVVGRGTDLLNLAELFRLLGDFSRSAVCLRRAVRCFRQAGSEPLLELADARLKEAMRIIAVLQHDARLN